MWFFLGGFPGEFEAGCYRAVVAASGSLHPVVVFEQSLAWQGVWQNCAPAGTRRFPSCARHRVHSRCSNALCPAVHTPHALFVSPNNMWRISLHATPYRCHTLNRGRAPANAASQRSKSQTPELGLARPIVVAEPPPAATWPLHRRDAPEATPWAAQCCFASVLAALLTGARYVAVGNERSANEGNGPRRPQDPGGRSPRPPPLPRSWAVRELLSFQVTKGATVPPVARSPKWPRYLDLVKAQLDPPEGWPAMGRPPAADSAPRHWKLKRCPGRRAEGSTTVAGR